MFLIKKGKKAIKGTNCYESADIHAVIEIKAHGLFGGNTSTAAAPHGELAQNIEKIKKNFDQAVSKNKTIKCAYLTLKEVTKPIKTNSINYFDRTKAELKYPAFCLHDSKDYNNNCIGEWQKFIYAID